MSVASGSSRHPLLRLLRPRFGSRIWRRLSTSSGVSTMKDPSDDAPTPTALTPDTVGAPVTEFRNMRTPTWTKVAVLALVVSLAAAGLILMLNPYTILPASPTPIRTPTTTPTPRPTTRTPSPAASASVVVVPTIIVISPAPGSPGASGRDGRDGRVVTAPPSTSPSATRSPTPSPSFCIPVVQCPRVMPSRRPTATTPVRSSK